MYKTLSGRYVSIQQQREALKITVEYVFDGKKIPNPNNLQLKPPGITVFNTIWSNTRLKTSLFETDININNLQDRANTLDDFKDLVINRDDKIFGFISVK